MMRISSEEYQKQNVPPPGVKKKRPSKKELIAKYVSESHCETRRLGINNPSGIPCVGYEITFYGKLRNIPSLKNTKIPGTNFTNPDVIARIAAMDIAFQRAAIDPVFFGNSEVYLITVNAQRSRNYDPIGALETVQDWLEPRFKPVGRTGRPRGWGIGLIDDDRQITPFTFRSETLGAGVDFTKILVVPVVSTPTRIDITPILRTMGFLNWGQQ